MISDKDTPVNDLLAIEPTLADHLLFYSTGFPPGKQVSTLGRSKDAKETGLAVRNIGCYDAPILKEWNPDVIAARMIQRRADNQILKVWASKTHPADSIRWAMHPEMSYLSDLPKTDGPPAP